MALPVQIWSDIACPWCYVGQKRLLIAAQNLEVELEIEWHSFELDRSPLKPGDSRDTVQRLANKYRKSHAQAQAMVDQMARTGAEVGIDFQFAKSMHSNTFDAHRLLHLAKSISLPLQSQLKVALFDAHFTQGKDISDKSTLLSIAESVGIDLDRATSMFSTDEFTAEVRADEQGANDAGITGVPFFVIGKHGVGGAQSPAVFEEVILAALAEQEVQGEQEGAICTPEGC